MNGSRIALYAFAALLLAAGLSWNGQLSSGRHGGFFSEADAVIGRPLTPVSYAGVARRTVRRCAAGVYYC